MPGNKIYYTLSDNIFTIIRSITLLTITNFIFRVSFQCLAPKYYWKVLALEDVELYELAYAVIYIYT